MITVFLLYTKRRYEEISHISEQLDLVLHNTEHLYIADSMADIAHQLRTPLTSLNLILTLLEKTPDEQERKKLLREAKLLLNQMEWLMNSLLKISRLDAGIVVFQIESYP